MGIIVKKFTEEHIDWAVDIFLKIYNWEQEVNHLLPTQLMTDPERIGNWIRLLLQNGPGVALFQDRKMIAYMITGSQFTFKGQNAVIIPEYAHGAEIDMDVSWCCLYQQMYKELSSQWVKEGVHLHLMGFLAHDQELKDILFQLGFGALIAERIRDLSDIPVIGPELKIERLGDPAELLDIHREHHAYYPEAPIFIQKPLEKDILLQELQSYNDEGDALFVFRDGDGIGAYIVVGESAREGEGFLLQNTNTAQIKQAYVKPEFRRQGIGSALLNRAVGWAREEGFDALFVEHETSNIYGSSFWGKYFEPYVYFAMRYIDNSL